MRIYTAADEEVLRARTLLKGWAADGLLTPAQYQQMEEETVCDLRRTNIFLRLVLFLFSLLIVGALTGLLVMFLSRPSDQAAGVFYLVFAGMAYAAAEFAASEHQLYHFGIEEALAAGSVGFLCAGLQISMFDSYSPVPDPAAALVPAGGASFSLWIWRRFGHSYAFIAAMIFVVFLPGYWTSSPSAQHGIVAVFYVIGLAGVAAARARHRFDYLNDGYSLVEAALWLGIYLAINLQLSSVNPLVHGWGVSLSDNGFSKAFYWATWLLTWFLPSAILARGVRQRDRAVIAAGAIAALFTLATNKLYLGWQRHTWDPMLLGLLLIGIALFLRRYLASGPDGIRQSFTAERISGKDQAWLNSGSVVVGVLSPGIAGPGLHSDPEAPFGGGKSGGGGASSDF